MDMGTLCSINTLPSSTPPRRVTAWCLIWGRASDTVVLGVWMREVLGAFDHEHRPGQDARIERRAVAGIGEAPLPRQALPDDLVGRAPGPHSLPAGVVGRVKPRQQPLQVAVAGDGDPEHLPLHAPVEALDH